ncbi:hypothetical protein Hanom_Chr07g00610141 [Helianthus anomalus]
MVFPLSRCSFPLCNPISIVEPPSFVAAGFPPFSPLLFLYIAYRISCSAPNTLPNPLHTFKLF